MGDPQGYVGRQWLRRESCPNFPVWTCCAAKVTFRPSGIFTHLHRTLILSGRERATCCSVCTGSKNHCFLSPWEKKKSIPVIVPLHPPYDSWFFLFVSLAARSQWYAAFQSRSTRKIHTSLDPVSFQLEWTWCWVLWTTMCSHRTCTRPACRRTQSGVSSCHWTSWRPSEAPCSTLFQLPSPICSYLTRSCSNIHKFWRYVAEAVGMSGANVFWI